MTILKREENEGDMTDDISTEGPEHCPHCGREVVGEFDFCPHCGKGLRVMKIPQIMFHPAIGKACEKCSSKIDVASEYCPYCGHRQGSAVRPEQPPLAVEMVVLYIISFLVPPVGVIIWLTWKKDSEGGTRNEGEYCLGSAFLGLVVYLFLISIYT